MTSILIAEIDAVFRPQHSLACPFDARTFHFRDSQASEYSMEDNFPRTSPLNGLIITHRHQLGIDPPVRNSVRFCQHAVSMYVSKAEK